MRWFRSIGGWIAAVVMSALAGLGALAWWRERKRRKGLEGSVLSAAKRRAAARRELARERLDAAVERGQTAVAEADRAAAEEVEHATRDHDLVDHLLDADPGSDG